MTAAGFRKMRSRTGENPPWAFRSVPTCSATAAGTRGRTTVTTLGAIQPYLGHENIQHSVRYTELAADRFEGFGGA